MMGLLFPKPDSKQERADARSGKIARRKALYSEAYSLANGHCLFCLARGDKKTLAGQFHHLHYGAGGRVEESANDIMPCCYECHAVAQADSIKRIGGRNGRKFVIWTLETLNLPRFDAALRKLKRRAK